MRRMKIYNSQLIYTDPLVEIELKFIIKLHYWGKEIENISFWKYIIALHKYIIALIASLAVKFILKLIRYFKTLPNQRKYEDIILN
jgi:hypothetical protein